MIPIYQNNSDPSTGDCLNACIASILEVDPKTIPPFKVLYQGHTFYREVRDWLWAMHKKHISWYKSDVYFNGYYIIGYLAGVHPNTGQWVGHAVVGRKNKPVHCPVYGKDFQWWMKPERAYLYGVITGE